MSWKDLIQLLALQQPAIRNPIAISFGAIAGALSRYYLTLWFVQRFGTSFPYGTFFINLTGCFAMGFFATLALERAIAISPEVRLLVAVGFLGSYTTFSTYGLDTVALARNHQIATASLYWLGSALLGIVCVQLGA
ncbi:fluoride efflux transporter CrcB, partial [Chroococcidiopsis sp.]|uniref:fluoride efflux transporter CrcB n=1 Tax=Chroococcidiopsis sp. TaxID=3088168 RepID=UPI003F3F7B9C